MCKIKALNMGAFRNKSGVHEGLPVGKGMHLGMLRSGPDEVPVVSRCTGVVAEICADGDVFTNDVLYRIEELEPPVTGGPPRAMKVRNIMMVFIASSGDRYHNAGCRYLGRGTRSVPHDDVAASHTQCNHCAKKEE